MENSNDRLDKEQIYIKLLNVNIRVKIENVPQKKLDPNLSLLQ
jgi:hypothetical protein